jgi:hypothetical protein
MLAAAIYTSNFLKFEDEAILNCLSKKWSCTMTNKDVTHQIAVERLRAAGADAVADKLAAFRSRDAT